MESIVQRAVGKAPTRTVDSRKHMTYNTSSRIVRKQISNTANQVVSHIFCVHVYIPRLANPSVDTLHLPPSATTDYNCFGPTRNAYSVCIKIFGMEILIVESPSSPYLEHSSRRRCLGGSAVSSLLLAGLDHSNHLLIEICTG